MQGVKINSCDSTDSETILLSLISVEPLMLDRCYWCMQHLGEKYLPSLLSIWEHTVLLLCALGGGGALLTECPWKGQFQEDADSSLVCGVVRFSSGSGLWILLSVPWEESVSLWRLSL